VFSGSVVFFPVVLCVLRQCCGFSGIVVFCQVVCVL